MNRYYFRTLGEKVRISNDTRQTGLNNNDLICGASGAGKSGSIVYAQLKSLQDSSLIVVDSKNRMMDMFSEELREKGYRVQVLDFIHPEQSIRYNPLDYIRKGTKKNTYREQDIANHHEKYWVLNSRTVMEFFIAYTLQALPEEDHHMQVVSRVARMFFSPTGEGTIRPWLDKHPDSLATKRYLQIKSMQAAEKMMASFFGFITLALRSFDYEETKVIFDPNVPSKKGWLDITWLARKKTVLFLNVSDSDHSMDALVNIFYMQALQTLVAEADRRKDGQLQVPVRIVMDDFASGATIPDFDKIISVVRSRDIWLTLCIQSFTQLESLYSEAQALTIVNNCDHIVYLGGNDLKSAEFIGTRAMKTPEKILCMDRSMEYVLEAGKPAELIRKIPPYRFEEPETEMADVFDKPDRDMAV